MVYRVGQFEINGKHSSEFNTYLRSRPQRSSAERAIELKQRSGNDSIVFDFGYYKNAEWKIQCIAHATTIEDISQLEDRIKCWLDMSNYSDFAYSFDKYYIYQAIVVKPPVFNGTHKDADWIPFEFTISLRPFKQSKTGLRWLSNEKEIYNIERYSSKPKIHILGSEDISFWINNNKFELINIGNEIIIDSRIEESYRIVDDVIESQDNKTKFVDFPILSTGLNTIKWQGNVKEFKILPRWCTKI